MTHDELLAKIVQKEPGTLTYSDGEILHSTRRLVSWQLALRQRQGAVTALSVWKRCMVQPQFISKVLGFTAQTRGAGNGKDLGNSRV